MNAANRHILSYGHTTSRLSFVGGWVALRLAVSLRCYNSGYTFKVSFLFRCICAHCWQLAYDPAGLAAKYSVDVDGLKSESSYSDSDIGELSACVCDCEPTTGMPSLDI